MNKKAKSLKASSLDYLEWNQLNPVGNIPPQVAKEGAGENRIPFAHLANSIPVYLFFKEMLEQKRNIKANILDVGCGTGRNISFVTENLGLKKYNIFGVDHSRACISYAKKQYKKQGVQFKVYSGKILPFKDRSFNYLISSHVIEHISKEGSLIFLSEIHRVLKKGAKAVIGTPNRTYCQDLFHINVSDEKQFRLILPHEHEYYLPELKNIIAQRNNLFNKYSIYQTINPINRRLMMKAVNQIKLKPGFLNQLKFKIYLFLRSFNRLQDIMARTGTEYFLKTMKTSYKELTESTSYIKNDKQDIGDNFIIVLEKS